MTQSLKSASGMISLAGVALLMASASALAAPVGPPKLGGPAQTTIPTGYALAYQLSCGAFMKPGGVIYRVGVVNAGPGIVPVGTKIHWVMNVQPGGTYQNDYAFTAPLAANGRVWVPSLALPFSFNSAPCTVTVLKKP